MDCWWNFCFGFSNIYNQFVTSEEGLDLALEYVRTIRPDVKTKGKDGKEIVIPGKKTKLVVIDSLAALVSSTETDGKKAGEVRSFNDNNGNLSGYAYGENVGWINFDPTYGYSSVGNVGFSAGHQSRQFISIYKYGSART